MDLLLDTHVFIWSQQEPHKLGRGCTALLLEPANRRFFHTISTLEIARLAANGRLTFRSDPNTWLHEALAALQAETLELSHRDALGAYMLAEPFHKDPCDRILVSAAKHRGLRFITADERILAYPHVSALCAAE